MPKRNLKIFSFFSGSGFLDLGFETNGFDVEFVNEFHPAFMNAYKYSREKMGLRKPTYGYFQGDINEFLSERKTTFCPGLLTQEKMEVLLDLLGDLLALIFLLLEKTKAAMEITENCRNRT